MKNKSEKELAREQFTKYLTERRLKRTPERYAILDKIYSKKQPFDVESLLADMAGDKYNVSRATIYNTIKILLDCGLLLRYQFGESVKYERILGKTISHYLICNNCGKVSTFADEGMDIFLGNRKIPQFNVLHYTISVYGKCAKCNRKKL